MPEQGTVGKAIGEASFIAYLDYVVRDELMNLLREFPEWKEEKDPAVVAMKLQQKILSRLANDAMKRLPEVLNDTGKMLEKAAKK